MMEYAIYDGFTLEGSQSQVCPQVAHTKKLGLIFPSKQALNNEISRWRTDAQGSSDQH
jgi:hypothetical protein